MRLDLPPSCYNGLGKNERGKDFRLSEVDGVRDVVRQLDIYHRFISEGTSNHRWTPCTTFVVYYYSCCSVDIRRHMVHIEGAYVLPVFRTPAWPFQKYFCSRKNLKITRKWLKLFLTPSLWWRYDHPMRIIQNYFVSKTSTYFRHNKLKIWKNSTTNFYFILPPGLP